MRGRILWGVALPTLSFLAVACGSAASSPPGSGGYCLAARAVRDAYAVLNNFGSPPTIQEVQAAYAEITRKVEAAAAAAPPDVTSGWQTVRRFAEDGDAAIQSATDIASAGLAVQHILATEQATADAAVKRIDTYTRAACGFELMISGTASPN